VGEIQASGFELVQDLWVAEVNSAVRFYRHKKTGAQVLSLTNKDENKVFGITFRTPPDESTGLPHIMEHSVLCGSRKYPVKEPFVELLKGSLKTFLNAFTMPDRTLYPVASQNLKDFYNLVDVYLDAVFFPLLSEHTLQQEGWHYELDELTQPLVYKGVVYNEMKGVYSSPDNLLWKYIQQTLYPDTIYRFDSGGDPEIIPSLTYPKFKQFHQTYYHPSNAYIYFYGDDPEEDRLKLLDRYLSLFTVQEMNGSVSPQPLFDQPKRVEFPYDAGESIEDKKNYLTVNWLLPARLDFETTLGLDILSHVLFGSPASPLRKALLESGLGEDLAGRGADDSLLQISFSSGMKGVTQENLDRLESLILDTLQNLVSQGIDRDTIAASLNTIEFALRENNTGSYPRGLVVMLRVMRDWVHHQDPISPLYFEEPLGKIKARFEARESYFEQLIQKYFLENSHRVTLILKPDPGLGERWTSAEQARLTAARQEFTDLDLRKIVENTRILRDLQSTPDTPESLASIPRLQLSDLEREIRVVPQTIEERYGAKILHHDLFTNDILYLDIAFNLQSIPQNLLPYLPLFARALVEIGTEKENYVRLAQRIGQKTGGIFAGTYLSATVDPNEQAAWFMLRGKATREHSFDLLDIIEDLLLTVRLDDQERFKQMALESKARREAGLIPGGHQVVNTRLRAAFHPSDYLSEMMGGVSYLFFLRNLITEIDKDWPTVLSRLQQLRQLLINRQGMMINGTTDMDQWMEFLPSMEKFILKMPARKFVPAAWEFTPLPAHEGLLIPAQVNYVGKGANLFDLGYQLHGSILVINKFLQTTWLWEKIRVQGGAYGGFGTFDQLTGVYAFLSYRDPNLLETLNNYDQTAGFLRQLKLPQEELTKSIIGVISDLDSYQLPDAKGYSAFARTLIGIDDARRQRLRDEVLTTTADHFEDFANVLELVAQSGRVVVLGSSTAIEAANQQSNNRLTVQKIL
jgi:presequence protease